jgi:hypothetical protein
MSIKFYENLTLNQADVYQQFMYEHLMNNVGIDRFDYFETKEFEESVILHLPNAKGIKIRDNYNLDNVTIDNFQDKELLFLRMLYATEPEYEIQYSHWDGIPFAASYDRMCWSHLLEVYTIYYAKRLSDFSYYERFEEDDFSPERHERDIVCHAVVVGVSFEEQRLKLKLFSDLKQAFEYRELLQDMI